MDLWFRKGVFADGHVTVSLCSLGPALCCVLRLSGPLKQQYAQVA